ncbi:hypothetical protein [Sneathia sanguinegens]|uniref:Uncharacterized protein n=1 Tax=Sneathia sanguinegens TaxID=40543 RepID=A0ABT7HKV8_9FUSO|nr:hypothetical protein [Sneathia sanguinegens]MDK9581173.1 hypothetical protein [Sneathia sanguinegens]
MENTHIFVRYKKPYSDLILTIMSENSLFEENVLLNNIEKIIPVSKILKGKNNKKILGISYKTQFDGIQFDLSF